MDPAPEPRSFSTLLLAVVLAGAASMVAVRLVLTRRRRRLARRGHEVVPVWVEIGRALRREDGAAPEILALALAGYELDVALAQPVRARLPCAVASAAEAAGLKLDEVQRAIVRKAATDAGAREALEELSALRPRLEALPMVRRVGALWPDAPGPLCDAIRHYTRAIGLVTPPRG